MRGWGRLGEPGHLDAGPGPKTKMLADGLAFGKASDLHVI